MSGRIRSRFLSLTSLAIGLGLLLDASPASAAPQLRFETTARGRVITTGNTLGLSKAIGENAPGTSDSIGTFISLDETSIDDSPAGSAPWAMGTTNDWTANGSNGTLDVPPSDFFSDILYAELVWGGSTVYGGEDVTDSVDTPVTLSYGSESISVTPDMATAQDETGQSASNFPINYYLRSADVTDFVREHRGGEYAVSGVPATQDLGINSLNAAGWTLIVVFRDDGELERNLSVFVGGSFVDEDTIEDYTFAGFCAPPTGVVNGKAFVSAVEGDASFSGDQLSIAQTGAGPFVALSGPNNPVNNFFGSQINDISGNLDDRGSFGDVNHDAELATNVVGGRQGWDVTAVAVGSADGSLNAGQQSAVLRVDTTGDSFLPATVSFEIDVNAPNFNAPNAFVADHNVVYEGDEVDFTITLNNVGTAAAEDLQLKLPLGDHLELTAFAIDGVDGDANQATVTTAGMTTGVLLGDIAPGGTKVLTFSAQVASLPPVSEPALFSLQPAFSYDYVTCVGDPAISGNAGLPAVELQAARLGLALSGEASSGLQIDYTATVDNSGSVATQGATFELQIPAGTTYVAGSTTLNGSAVADVGGESPFLGGGLMASNGASDGVVEVPDGQAVITFSVLADGAGTYDNTVFADPDGDEPAPEIEASAQVVLDGDDGGSDDSGDEGSGDGGADATDTADSGDATAGDSGEGTGEDGSGTDGSTETTGGFDPGTGGGGDGCDCRTEGGRSSGLLWVLSFGLWGWRRRRRA